MSKNQQPLWHVFSRSSKSIHHKEASSLHAPNEDTALLYARDVYARRSEGISLWIFREDTVFKEGMDFEVKEAQTFEVFTRRKAGIEYLHTGSIVATSPKEALDKALETLIKAKEGVSIWVVPTDKIIASDPAESESLFETAADKYYRHARFYDVPDEIQHM